MITIYIVRHGETDYNKESRYLGRADISLNSTGREQATELRRTIKNLHIDTVISSPLKRAVETAKIILPDNEIATDYHFIERSTGVYEGLTKKEASIKYPDFYKKNITRIFNEAPPKGETIHRVQERVFEGLDRIKNDYYDKNIIIITHAFIAKIVNKYFNPQLTDEDFFDFVLPNAQVQKYTIN
ncbi:MAG: histidine phosphatase family protein [Patescibacteria group bacterium]|nr:histidine phosphatase family protein [Patescibacteria group bacterium]